MSLLNVLILPSFVKVLSSTGSRTARPRPATRPASAVWSTSTGSTGAGRPTDGRKKTGRDGRGRDGTTTDGDGRQDGKKTDGRRLDGRTKKGYNKYIHCDGRNKLQPSFFIPTANLFGANAQIISAKAYGLPPNPFDYCIFGTVLYAENARPKNPMCIFSCQKYAVGSEDRQTPLTG